VGTFLDDISSDLADRFGGVVTQIEELMESNGGDALFRRFQKSYARLGVEDIMAVQNSMGHREGEEKPCKVCREMAKQELRLDG